MFRGWRFLSLRSAKLSGVKRARRNGRSERANRTHAEEFYEITPFSLPLTELNRELEAWEQTYNTVRPHQALGYLTPLQFLAKSSLQRKKPQCH